MIRRGPFRHLLLACATPAFAHHGGGSFDLTKSVTFTGVLTKIELINPHSWIYFEVKEADGKMSKHRCEMRSAHVLPPLRLGERALSNRAGRHDRGGSGPRGSELVLPEHHPLRQRQQDGPLRPVREGPGGGVTEVRGVLATANLEKAKARPAKRPSGEPNITGEWAPEQVVMADPRGTGGGLVPLSTLATAKPAERGGGAARRGGGPPAGPRLYGGSELTPEGEKAAAAFKREDNPRFSCQTTSILFDWTFDGPVNRITQNKDTVVIEYGQMNLKRTVYMNQKTHPATVKLTRAGHSIGSWDGDTLVVDTVGFLPGVPQRASSSQRQAPRRRALSRWTRPPTRSRVPILRTTRST
jgi:hypothetical protein